MDKLLTVKETAELIKVSRSSIYRHCIRGLPHIKKSFGIRIKHHDLEKWLEQDKRKIVLADNILKNVLTNSPPIAMDNAGGEKVANKKSRHNYGFGAIYIRETKAGKPRFYLDYYDRNRRRVQKLVKNVTTWQGAHEALKNAVLKEHYEECGIKESKQQIKFKEFADIFIENYSRINKRSWKDDKYRLQKVVNFFGDIYLHELTPLDVEKFKAEKLKEGVTKSTVNRYMAILKTMFNIAITWGYTKDNPVREVRFFSEKDNLKERILIEEEEDRLFEASSEHLIPILIVALNTGMRRGEILNLKWSQIDYHIKEIRVENTKSGKPRIIDINSHLLTELMRLKNKAQDSQYVFLNPKTGKPYKKLQTSFNGACRRAGIEGLRFHDLRHTFASRLVERGIDLIRVKELLGHSSVKMTERYTHSNREERKKAVELLCRESANKPKILENLLHSCDTDEGAKKSAIVSSLFSVN